MSLTDDTVCLFLLDMSKAFDSIQGNTIIEDLKNVVTTKASFSALTQEFTFYRGKSLETTIFNDTPSLEEQNNI